MLILTSDDVRRVFDMNTALEATWQAARAHTEGRTSPSARTALATTSPAAEFLVMPGTIDARRFAVKTWYTADIAGRRSTHAWIFALDPETGEEALLDGGVVTDLRTGAMTGIAARHLAPAGATVATIIGAGLQARTQALALAHCVPTLRTLRVASRTAERRDRLVASLETELSSIAPEISVVAAHDTAEACRESSIIVAATTSPSPVISDAWVRDDALVCSVGSHTPDEAEIDPETVARAAVVAVDTHTGGIDGAGDIGPLIARGLIRREDVLELGRLGEADSRGGGVRVFKSVGFAAADIEAAHVILLRALSQGIGTRIPLHDPS